MARKSMGRQKVEMKKMNKESNLQVTFSKRRSGLFKKASELCTLCGAEIGIVVFSPGNKVFSFGHPGVDAVVDRFLGRNPPRTPAVGGGAMQLVEAHRNASVRELNVQLTQVLNQLEMEKKRGEELSQMRKARQSEFWWENPIEDLNLTQLQQLKSSLEELKKTVTNQVDKLLILPSLNPPPFFFPSTSNNLGPPHDVKPNMVPQFGFNYNNLPN